MTETPDPQLQLKKRARRRLVGAVAFAGFAAVILPMVMDEEPKQPVQDVQIRIPGQDQAPFQPRELAARAAPSPPTEVNATVAEQQAKAAAADALPKAAVAAVPLGKVAASAPTKSPDKPVDKKTVKPTDKAPDKATEKKVVKPLDKPAEKPVDKKTVKTVDKAPERATEKKVDKTADKAPEKPAVRKVDKPAEKSPDTVSEEAAKPAPDEAPHATPPPTAKPAEAATAKTDGRQVILIGAFANPDNARQLQGKIGGVGVSTYTEVIDSPDGKKTRVRAGPFPNREAAEKALEKLKKIGVSGVVAGRQ